MSEEAGRDNKDKPDLSLIPYCFEVEVAEVMMMGSRKYQRMNYAKGHRITSLIASIKRHVGKLLSGQDIDEESGKSHWAHIAAGCLMAIHQIELGTIKDDRFKPDTLLTPVLPEAKVRYQLWSKAKGQPQYSMHPGPEFLTVAEAWAEAKRQMEAWDGWQF